MKELRSIGIQPDCIMCRSDFPVSEDIKDKIALFCDVKRDAVIPLPTAESIYEVPLVLQEAGLSGLLAKALGLGDLEPDLRDWEEIVGRIQEPKTPLSVAVVGKYANLPEAYISVKEALHHAGLFHHRDVEVKWVPSEDVEREGADRFLKDACGIVVPGGFGPRGVDGMVEAVRYAREHQVPFLGLCLGMQLMVVERTRSCAGLPKANSTEFDTETPDPGDRPDAGAAGDQGDGWHHALGRVPLPHGARHHCGEGVQAGCSGRAAPPPLRAQQRLPRAA